MQSKRVTVRTIASTTLGNVWLWIDGMYQVSLRWIALGHHKQSTHGLVAMTSA